MSDPFQKQVGKGKIKDMRIETVDRGPFEDIILLCIFDNGNFASFDLTLL